MADLKVRAEAWGLARLFVDMGGDLTQLQPGPDGWHSSASIQASIAKRVADNRAAREAAARQTPASVPTMTPEDAYRSGRILDLQEWHDRYDADPQGVGQTLAILAPVGYLAARNAGHRPGAVTDGYYPSAPGYVPPAGDPATPRLNALDEALFGPAPEVRRRRQDLAAERALDEQETREAAEAAHRALTEDEMRALFPPGLEGFRRA